MSKLITDDQVFDILRKIVIDSLRVPPEEITKEARFYYDLGAESIDILDIGFHIEEAFGFKIGDEEIAEGLGVGLTPNESMERFTFGWLFGYVKDRLQQKGSV